MLHDWCEVYSPRMLSSNQDLEDFITHKAPKIDGLTLKEDTWHYKVPGLVVQDMLTHRALW